MLFFVQIERTKLASPECAKLLDIVSLPDYGHWSLASPAGTPSRSLIFVGNGYVQRRNNPQNPSRLRGKRR